MNRRAFPRVTYEQRTLSTVHQLLVANLMQLIKKDTTRARLAFNTAVAASSASGGEAQPLFHQRRRLAVVQEMPR